MSLTRDDVAEVVAVVARRIDRLLARRGLTATTEEIGATDTWAEEAPTLAGLAAASVQGRIALGPRAGAGVARYGRPPEEVAPITVGPCHAHVGGFDLHAGILVRAGERERLERLCRYTLRPPIAQKRLRVDADGYVWIALRHPWSDGTTHLRFEPVALLERLAALIPRPRIKLTWGPPHTPARSLAGTPAPRAAPSQARRARLARHAARPNEYKTLVGGRITG